MAHEATAHAEATAALASLDQLIFKAGSILEAGASGTSLAEQVEDLRRDHDHHAPTIARAVALDAEASSSTGDEQTELAALQLERAQLGQAIVAQKVVLKEHQ